MTNTFVANAFHRGGVHLCLHIYGYLGFFRFDFLSLLGMVMPTENSPYDPILYDDWHVVAIADHIKPDRPLQVKLLGETLSLWRSHGKIIACQDRCPHRGVALSLGEIDEKGEIVCPYHAMSFNKVGQCTRIPADSKVTSFPKKCKLADLQNSNKVRLCLGVSGRACSGGAAISRVVAGRRYHL